MSLLDYDVTHDQIDYEEKGWSVHEIVVKDSIWWELSYGHLIHIQYFPVPRRCDHVEECSHLKDEMMEGKK